MRGTCLKVLVSQGSHRHASYVSLPGNRSLLTTSDISYGFVLQTPPKKLYGNVEPRLTKPERIPRQESNGNRERAEAKYELKHGRQCRGANISFAKRGSSTLQTKTVNAKFSMNDVNNIKS